MSASHLLLIATNSQVAAEWEWQEDVCITWVAQLAQALALLETEVIDCVLVAGDVPGHAHMDLLEKLGVGTSTIPIAFWTEHMSAAEAALLVRNGASHCFGRGDGVDAVREWVESTCREGRARRLEADGATAPWAKWFIGESRAMRDVFDTIRLVGPRRCTVLITGETGTGKEMAARALHAASPRAHLPLVALNCSALPEHLLEAELFGHVKGAFTGAIGNRIGRFEQAHKSTLFLDEVGEMPLDLQTKLLRVLQERELQRLGSSETIRVDVRVVAASNSDLLEKVRQGKFREDLFYRLNVVPLRMPPLRERRGDIPVLVDHFVEKICRAEDIPQKQVTPNVKECLRHLAWPGNVRQLENLVEASIALSGDRQLLTSANFGLHEASFSVTPAQPGHEAFTLSEPVNFNHAVSQFEQSLLQRALAKARGNKTVAADLLRLKRTTLIMKLRSVEGSNSLLATAV